MTDPEVERAAGLLRLHQPETNQHRLPDPLPDGVTFWCSGGCGWQRCELAEHQADALAAAGLLTLAPAAPATPGVPDDDVELWNELLADAPDDWDGEEGIEAIAIRYVRHLEAEVDRLGGCRRTFCHDIEPPDSWDEPCDHGRSSPAAAAPGGAPEPPGIPPSIQRSDDAPPSTHRFDLAPSQAGGAPEEPSGDQERCRCGLIPTANQFYGVAASGSDTLVRHKTWCLSPPAAPPSPEAPRQPAVTVGKNERGAWCVYLDGEFVSDHADHVAARRAAQLHEAPTGGGEA